MRHSSCPPAWPYARVGLWFLALALLVPGVLAQQQNKQKQKGNNLNAEEAAIRSPLNSKKPDKVVAYRKTDKGELTVHFFYPEGWKVTDKRPAVLLFFGGGYRVGAPSAMYGKAAYLASRGVVAASADYRTKSSHGVNAEAAFADGRSAMRFVRAHAAEYGIDPDKLIAGGASSGGDLAASLAYGTGPDNPEDDQKVSTVPAALLLYNPAVVKLPNTQLIEGTPEEKARIEALTSPVANLKAKGPPMILFFGTEDFFMRPGKQFCEKAIPFGTRAELYSAEGQQHGFVNASPWHEAVLRKSDEFLVSLGFLTGEPTMKVAEKAVLVKVLP